MSGELSKISKESSITVSNTRGRKLYDNKEQLRAVIDILDNPNIVNFFKEHINNTNDIQLVKMIIDTMEIFEKEWNAITNKPLNKYQKADIINTALSKRGYRSEVIKNYLQRISKQIKLLEN